MSILVLIPARMAATRLPGKPLADIAGKPMVVRVAERYCAMAKGAVVAEGAVVHSRQGLHDLEAHVMV